VLVGLVGLAGCKDGPPASPADAALAVVAVAPDAGPAISVWRVWDGGSEPWTAETVRPLPAPVTLRATIRDVPPAAVQAAVSHAQAGTPAGFDLATAAGPSGGSVVTLAVTDLVLSGRLLVVWRQSGGPDGGLVALGASEIELSPPPAPVEPPKAREPAKKPRKRRR